MRLVVIDATPTGRETARLLLDDVPNPVTLRELITHRVREEVARYNANPVPRPRRIEVLSVILSKIVLLAADDKIKDPSIRGQLVSR